MRENDRRRLPDWILEGYDILRDRIDDPCEGIKRDQAYQVLLDSGEFPNEATDAEYAIDRLLNRGYFYEVEGNLRVTEPNTDEE